MRSMTMKQVELEYTNVACKKARQSLRQFRKMKDPAVRLILLANVVSSLDRVERVLQRLEGGKR